MAFKPLPTLSGCVARFAVHCVVQTRYSLLVRTALLQGVGVTALTRALHTKRGSLDQSLSSGLPGIAQTLARRVGSDPTQVMASSCGRKWMAQACRCSGQVSVVWCSDHQVSAKTSPRDRKFIYIERLFRLGFFPSQAYVYF